MGSRSPSGSSAVSATCCRSVCGVPGRSGQAATLKSSAAVYVVCGGVVYRSCIDLLATCASIAAHTTQQSASASSHPLTPTRFLLSLSSFRFAFLQDDLLYESLTVQETLYYAAMLRLPRHMSHEDKLRRIDLAVTALGLGQCKDTIIGGFFRKGISGEAGGQLRLSVCGRGGCTIVPCRCIWRGEPDDGCVAAHLPCCPCVRLQAASASVSA